MINIFGRKDPVCGMREKKGSGLEADGKWFCSQRCRDEFEKDCCGSGSKDCCGGKKDEGCCH